MNHPIRIGIHGYGNLGRGVECAVKQNPDMKLVRECTKKIEATAGKLSENEIRVLEKICEAEGKAVPRSDIMEILLYIERMFKESM